MKLALLISNRGFFPSSVITSAREDMCQAAKRSGLELIMPDTSLTRYGAVETAREGEVFAAFLREPANACDGVIICLPNFGDENGIKAAIRDVREPILLQAYPDEIGKMDFANRRDAFCGKLGLTSVFKQMDLKYTSGLPFVMHPLGADFEKELNDFAAVCRVVKGMRHMRLGVVGARTTAFKSVRFDEIAMERRGVDVEAMDLTMLLRRMEAIKADHPAVAAFCDKLHASASFEGVPDGVDTELARLGAALEALVNDMGLDALAIRCWSELQTELRLAPCSVMGILNQTGVPTVCETDATNALAMMALSLASRRPAGCLDLNNNYGDDTDKCILFHCGPLPMDLMAGPGHIEEHKMFVKTMGDNCSWGLNIGRIRPGEITLSGVRTDNGQVYYYIDEAEITDDPVESGFFGTPGVMRLPGLHRKVAALSEAGFRHHTIITRGCYGRAVSEALTKYLGYSKIGLD
jgi:L-fucose isomerase-like protein